MRKEFEELLVKQLKSWEYCKKRLLICVAPKGSLENCITFPYLDLDAYVRVIFSTKESNDQISGRVNDAILKEWGIDRSELLSAAIECSQQQYRMRTLSDLFGMRMPVEQVAIMADCELHGAGSIMFTDTILQDVADFFDSDLIILPSSIHEIVYMSTNDADLEYASRVVREVNEISVREDERLSDHAYMYHRKTKIITW